MATEITELIQIPPNKKVIIDFYATWCGPCARVTPIIDDLADKFQNIVFLKVNVDEADEIAAGFEISQLPTFIYLNMGNIVQKIEGANLSDILSCIEKLDRVVNKEPEIRNKEVKDSEIPQSKEIRKESRREESKREEPKREEPKREEQKIAKRIERDVKREETKDERSLRKKLEARVQVESEAIPPKKIEMKISKSKETEKKKSKKQSSKESQKKAERRVFNNVNPYEIEYNNDTPKISTDDGDDSISNDSNSDKISSIDSISS